MADNENGSIFGRKGGDLFRDIKSETDNYANDISLTLDRIMDKVARFKDELERQKISLNIDTSYSQKIEQMLRELENDFNRSIAPVKERIQGKISEVFSSDSIKTDGLSQELNNFSENLSKFATKIAQLSEEIGNNLGAAFSKINRETIETLKSFSDVLGQLQQKADLKIENPFPEIIKSLDEIATKKDVVNDFASILSNMLNIPVKDGTAYHLVELSDSLDIFSKSIRGTTDEDINKLNRYIGELEKLSQKSKIFSDIAQDVKQLSIINDVTGYVNDLNTALNQLGQNQALQQLLGTMGSGVPAAQIIPAAGGAGGGSVPPAQPPTGGGGNPPGGGGYTGPTGSYHPQQNLGPFPFNTSSNYSNHKVESSLDAIERALSTLQLNNLSGSAWMDSSKKNMSDDNIKGMLGIVEQIKRESGYLAGWEDQFNKHSANHDTAGATHALEEMNKSRQRMQQGNKVLQEGLSEVDPKALKEGKFPDEVRDVVNNMKNFQTVLQNIMVSQFKFNDFFQVPQFNEEIEKANREVNDFTRNLENQPWDRIQNKISGVFNTVKNGLNSVKGGINTGLNMANLGALGGLLSPVKFAGDSMDIYQQQGRLLADSAQAELMAGYGYDPNHVRSVLDSGRSYQERTQGRIQSEEYLKNYTSLANSIRGHYGFTGQSKGQAESDIQDLAATTTVFKGMGVSDGTINNALNTMYKDLNMSVSETNYQFVKMAQTAQSLGVPLDEHIKQVTALAAQYRQLGLSADQASNFISNAMWKGGMTSTEANRFAGDITGVLGGKMNEGWLAYGAGMSGMYSDPLQAIVDLNYGYNDDGTMKAGTAEKKAQILTNNYRQFSAIPGAGGQYGAIQALQAMGISDPRTVSKFLNHIGDSNYLTDLFKDNADLQAKNGMTGINASNAADKISGSGTDSFVSQLSTAANQLSGIDKSLNAYNEVLKDMVQQHRSQLDEMTNLSNQIHALGGMMNGFIDQIAKLMDSFSGITPGGLSTLFTAGMIGLPIAGAVGGAATRGLARRAMNRWFGGGSRGGGSGGSSGGGSSSSGGLSEEERISRLPSEGGLSRAEGGGGAARSPSWLSRLAKTKGGKLAIAGAAITGIAGAWDYFHGNHAEAATTDDSNAGGGSTLDDVVGVLQQILAVLGGGGIVGGHGGGSYSVEALAHASSLSDDALGTNPLISLGTSAAGGYAAGKLANVAANVAEKKVTAKLAARATEIATGNAGEDAVQELSRVATAAAAKKAAGSSLARTLIKVGKTNAIGDIAFGGISAAMDIHDAHQLDALYGITDHSKSDTNIVGRAAGGTAGAIAGGAAGAETGAAIGAGIGVWFAGAGAIPGAAIGGAVGGLAGGIGGYFAGDKISGAALGAAGYGEKDIEAARMNNPLYRDTHDFMGRHKNVNEMFAITAMKGLQTYGSDLGNMSQDDKDSWAALFAKAKGEGKSDSDAKSVADKAFQVNFDIKTLNAQQLENQKLASQASGTYYESFNKYKEDYTKNTDEAKKVIDDTCKQTGLTVDALNDLYDLTSNLPEDLAAAIKAGGGLDGMDDAGKAAAIQKSMSALGIDLTTQQKGVEGYTQYSASLKQQMKSELERDTWLEAYGKSSNFVGPRLPGQDPVHDANNAVNKLRQATKAMGALFSQYNSDSSGPGAAIFQSDLDNSELPSGMTANSVISNYAGALGLNAGDITRLGNKNGMGADRLARYLMMYDGSGKFSDKAKALSTLGGADYTNIDGVDVSMSNDKLAQSNVDKINDQYAEAERTKKEYADLNKTTQENIYKQTENSTDIRNKELVGAIKSLESLMGDAAKNVWNKLDDINQNIINAVSILHDMSGGGSGGSTGGSVTSPTLVGNSNAQKIWNFLKGKGYSNASAAAVMGNFQQESDLSPTNLNSSSGAFGIGQWLGGRLSNLKSFAANNNMDYNSLEAQLAFYDYETSHGEQNSLDWNAFKKSTNVSDATNLFSDKFERAGINEKMNGRRVSFANDALASFGNANSSWSNLASSIDSLSDTANKQLDEAKKTTDNTTDIKDSSKQTADNTSSQTGSSSATNPYRAIITNIGQNDPYAGINIRSNMDNTKYIFDKYKNLGLKGLDYDDYGVDRQSQMQSQRQAFDVAVKVDFTDPSKMPYFTQILDKHLNSAVNNAVKEYADGEISKIKGEMDSLWQASASQVDSQKKGDYE